MSKQATIAKQVTKPAATKVEANEARRAAHMADNTAAGAVVKKAQASAKAAAVEDAAHTALIAKAAGLTLTGDTITVRLWDLLNQLGKPGTYPRRVAVEAALSHGMAPASASISFGRWQHTPDTPRSK